MRVNRLWDCSASCTFHFSQNRFLGEVLNLLSEEPQKILRTFRCFPYRSTRRDDRPSPRLLCGTPYPTRLYCSRVVLRAACLKTYSVSGLSRVQAYPSTLGYYKVFFASIPFAGCVSAVMTLLMYPFIAEMSRYEYRPGARFSCAILTRGGTGVPSARDGLPPVHVVVVRQGSQNKGCSPHLPRPPREGSLKSI